MWIKTKHLGLGNSRAQQQIISKDNFNQNPGHLQHLDIFSLKSKNIFFTNL